MPCRNVFNGKGGDCVKCLWRRKKGRAARCFLPYEILRRTCCFMALPCCMRLWLFVHHFICLDGFRSPADFLPMGKMPGERREEAVPRTLEDCDRDPAENILFCKLMRMWRRWNSDTCFTISPATVLPCWCAGLEFWTERSPVFQPRLNAARVNENVRCAHMIGNTGD